MIANPTSLTLQRVKEVLSYDPETGIFKWNAVRRGVRPGTPAGSIRDHGYLLLTIDYQRVLAHRLALFIANNGVWPDSVVDHIDGNTANNKLENLRIVPEQTNLRNVRKATKRNKSSGLLGVSYHARDKLWRARIYVNGKSKTWYSKDKDEAYQLYLKAKRALHAGCTI